MSRVRTAKLAASQHGIVTGRQLYELGLSDRQVQTDVRSGLLVPEHRGTFRHAAGQHSWKAALMAALPDLWSDRSRLGA